MKLAAKFTFLLIFGILILFVVDGYLLLQRDIQVFDEDMQRDAVQFCERLQPLIEETWKRGGDEEVARFLEKFNQFEKDSKSGDFEYSSVKWVLLDARSNEKNRPLATADELAQVVSEQVDSIRHVEQGKSYMVTYSRFSIGHQREPALEIAEPIIHPSESSYLFWRIFFLTAITFLLGSGMVVIAGRELVARPLQLLIDKTRRVGKGDLTGPVQLNRSDEFGELATSINSMCDQLSDARQQVEAETSARIVAMDQLRHADRLRTVGRLASGIAHEIGTPLNVVGGRAEMIASGGLSDDEIRKSARIIKTESDRIAKIIRHLLDFARRNTPNRETVNMIQLVEQTIELLRPLAEKNHVDLLAGFDSEILNANVDRGQLQQVLTNLILNAIHAMPAGGNLDIGLRIQPIQPPETEQASPGNYLLISVRDQGRGIAAEDLPVIFEPFFTTKDVGEGTGLGLSIAHGIILEHGGWIDVESKLDQGTCFTIYLPLERDA